MNALEDDWHQIQQEEPEIPAVIFYLTEGRSSSCATVSWYGTRDLIIRINLMHEGRNRNGLDILQQLLHLAAHAATPATSTASEGRYHSREFSSEALKFGLGVERQPGVGYFPLPDLSSATRKRYRPAIGKLDRAMRTWEPEVVRARQRGPVGLLCQCSPETNGLPEKPIRASSGVADRGGIVCTDCSQPFKRV